MLIKKVASLLLLVSILPTTATATDDVYYPQSSPQCVDNMVSEEVTIINEAPIVVIDYDMSESDFELVCGVVAAEARGEGLEGQMAVAQVIKNRHELWGKSINEVCTAKGQFAKPAKTFDETTYTAVHRVFRYDAKVFEEPITHFHTTSVHPKWANTKQVAGTLGAHIFYY